MATTTRVKPTTNCFAHDSNARSDEKVVRLRMKHGAAGYGVYFMILERLMEDSNFTSVKDYNMIAFDLRVDAALVKSVIEDFGLFVFTDDGKYFYSDSFIRRMDMKKTQSRQCSEGGKIGMEKRWKKVEDSPKEEATKEAQDEPVPEPSPTPEPKERPVVKTDNDNTAYLKRFFGKENRGNLETLMMNLGLKPSDTTVLRKAATDVITEWELSDKGHQDYTDWAHHLINTVRIKLADRSRSKQSAVMETPPADSDYFFGGGFGGNDV